MNSTLSGRERKINQVTEDLYVTVQDTRQSGMELVSSASVSTQLFLCEGCARCRIAHEVTDDMSNVVLGR